MSLLYHRESDNIFSNTQQPVLLKAEKPLFGRILLDVSGFARLQLRRGAKQTMEKVYVVKNLSTPLLGLPAIKALGLLISVDSTDMETLKTSYPKLCSRLGVLQQPYTIKLNPGAVFSENPQENSTAAGGPSQGRAPAHGSSRCHQPSGGANCLVHGGRAQEGRLKGVCGLDQHK